MGQLPHSLHIPPLFIPHKSAPFTSRRTILPPLFHIHMDAHALFQIFCVSQILHILFYIFFSPYFTHFRDFANFTWQYFFNFVHCQWFFSKTIFFIKFKKCFRVCWSQYYSFNQGDWFDDNIRSVNLSITSNIIWTSNYTLIEIFLTKNHLSAWKIRTKTI